MTRSWELALISGTAAAASIEALLDASEELIMPCGVSDALPPAAMAAGRDVPNIYELRLTEPRFSRT
jgi:hypothetical protein